jgi:1-deoxy-D-xylulose-5-phosphate reductoisomerase
VPILYALTYPERRPMPTARLDLVRAGHLTFFEPDVDKFPCLRLARQALEGSSSAPVVLNAANEIAVAAFLDRRVGFTEIAELIEDALEASTAGDLDSIEACVGVDADARRWVQRAIDTRHGARPS